MGELHDTFIESRGAPTDGEIRLHIRHLRDQKMKHEVRAETAEEAQERVDSLSKRGRLVPPNGVVAY